MSDKKRSTNMSLAIEEEDQDRLKKIAKTNNTSVSKLIRDVLETHLFQDKKVTIVPHEPDYVPIVLKVPTNLKGDREALQSWLKVRTAAIVERLSMPTPHEDS